MKASEKPHGIRVSTQVNLFVQNPCMKDHNSLNTKIMILANLPFNFFFFYKKLVCKKFVLQ